MCKARTSAAIPTFNRAGDLDVLDDGVFKNPSQRHHVQAWIRARFHINPADVLQSRSDSARVKRGPDVLQRYVQLMDAHPSAGYVFCPAMGMRDARETHVLDYSRYGERDRVIDGRRFLADLLNRNFIVAASAMARKACYEQISLFPMACHGPASRWT